MVLTVLGKLDAHKLSVVTSVASPRERAEREVPGGYATAGELAKALQSASDQHIWIHLLRTRTNERVASVDWEACGDHRS